MGDDFLSQYLSYSSNTEVPMLFHRWAAITGVGAYLGRQFHLDHGHFNIYPNIYCMLIGSPGTRKGTAIKLMRKLLESVGYKTFAAERTSKEKFLLDLSGQEDEQVTSPEDFLDQTLFGDAGSTKSPREMFVAIDEFNDFIGNGNIEFISMLGNMWDYHGLYKNRIKSGKSVEIQDPTINIIGGNTPTGFSLAFPTEVLGQGFFSRLMLIYGESTGKKIAFPKPPPAEATIHITKYLQSIKANCFGTANLTADAEKLLEKIYTSNFAVNDVRFDAYSNRRFIHLLKLTLICTAARVSRKIEEQDVIYANTILVYTERLMPKALGEFGKSKHSDVSHKIMQLADLTHTVLTFKQIWRHVNNDLEKMSDLATILQNLVAAEKLQAVPGGQGFLPLKKVFEDSNSSLYDFNLLTDEERKVTL